MQRPSTPPFKVETLVRIQQFGQGRTPLLLVCLRGPKDTTTVYGTVNLGSIPSGGAQYAFSLLVWYDVLMEAYKYTVKLTVEVEAFDEGDAWDALQDAFGVGETGAVTVTNCEYKEVRARKR